MDKIGRYEVIRELGHGAMGRVFLARDPSLERQVALKLLATATEGARQRFHDEAKALAALSHPGIVTIFEVSEHDGQDFIAMEYLPGRTLREMLIARQASRAVLVAICAKVATALAAAHRAGILHRDIKPENVVVTRSGDVKVVDFGIARRMHAEHRHTPRRFATPVEQRVDELVSVFADTQPTEVSGATTEVGPGTNTVFGTPGYMAPEVLVGEVSTEASDVYGLGVMLYECLAGRPPYEQATLVELIARVIDGTQRPPRLDDPLGELVERMLAREPTQRPSLAEIADALTAGPAAPPRRRRRWPLVAGVAVVLAGGGVGWRAMRGSRQPAAAPEAARLQAVIAVEPFKVTGSDPAFAVGGEYSLANAMAAAASRGSTPRVIGPDAMFEALKLARMRAGLELHVLSDAQLAKAEHDLGAQVAVRGTLELHDRQVRAHVQIEPVGGGAPYAVADREATVDQLASLGFDLAEVVIQVSDPRARIVRGGNTSLARELTTAGTDSLKDNAFFEAQLYLEQAILADPSLFDTWEVFALVLEWRFAPEEDIDRAIAKARELAPDETTKLLLTGADQFLREDYRAALATLSPLEAKLPSLGDRQKHDLLYYLGETHWHIGHQAVGVEYFKKVLDLDPHFAPAVIHPSEYALGRRDTSESRAMSYLGGSHRSESTDFALGRYEKLADSGEPTWAIQAQIVLGRPLTGELPASPLGHAIFELAGASEAGDQEAMRRAAAKAWEVVEHPARPLQPSDYYEVQLLGEVMICAGMLDDMRHLVTFLASAHEHDHKVSGFPRLQLLAAPLLHDKSLLAHEFLTERVEKLADASEAELAGDHARAASLLHELVADPSPSWDYPERAALLRNLRALGKTKDADALCADTLRPAIFRAAFMPLRKLCGKPARTSGRAKAR